jgi:anti-sigma regulatory factor (Ser/Thr protein kinase)
MISPPAKSRVHADDHVVLFYERERELVRIVGSHVAEASMEDGAAVVIATKSHLAAFTDELEAAGIDTERGFQRGTLVFLDAAETLASFTVAGHIDPEAFHQIIGSVLREAAEAGGPNPIRAYGEMVGLLWDAGDVLGAIELERLWNGLGQEIEFSLLCAYHSAAVSSPEQAAALQQVCHLHSSVLDAPGRAELSGEFPAENGAPRAARHFAVGALRSWGLAGSALDDVQLVLSELTTNAVVHARSPFSVTLRSDGSRLRISVSDRSPQRPTMRATAPTALSGRGLHLVAALAIDWGVDASADGKTVWATFAA